MMTKVRLLSALLLVILFSGCFKAKELDTLKKQCSFKEGQSCEKLEQIYKQSCDKNDADSCLELGRLYQNLPKRDFVSAKAYYKKAKDLGLNKAKIYLTSLEHGFIPATSASPFQYALIDIEGNSITEAKYSDFDFLNNGFIEVTINKSKTIFKNDPLNNLYGILNQEGKEILEPKFKEIRDYSEGLIAVKKDDKWGFVDEWGDIVIDFRFESVGDFNDGLAPVKQDGLFGFINKKGEFIIKPQFKGASIFHNSYALASKNKKWGIIDKKGNFIIQPIYNDINFFGDFFKVTLNEKISFIDASGKILMENIDKVNEYYDSVIKYSDNIFSIKVNKKWGLINQNLEVLLEPKFDEFDRIANGNLIKLQIDDKFGVANADFQILTEINFDAIDYRINDGLIAVQKEGKWGFMDINGKIVIPTIYEDVDIFQNGLGAIKLNGKYGKWGFIDKSGKMVIPAIYERVKSFSENLAAVQLDGKWGFINKKGEMVIKPQFTEVEDFYGEVAGILVSHDWGLINKKGEIIIEPQFKYLEYSSAKDGLIWAKARYDDQIVFMDKNGKIIEIPSVYYAEEVVDGKYITISVGNDFFTKKGLIDLKGNIILEPIYRDIAITDNIALLKIENYGSERETKYGFKNLENNAFVKAEYDFLYRLNLRQDEFIRFQKGSKVGLMDQNGKILIEPKFFNLKALMKLSD
ncbi:hypothetical protein B6S12_04510 [Helicobacter valdiviensis]|uniref:Beta-lactamase n=2 Tax=Helicobacter valdiviensis TaxID=1458358 RepID=A0A2W6NLL0_9HELI|nr:hypothetical protein B6S12_04510 [Helicobacter valdiviensis]